MKTLSIQKISSCLVFILIIHSFPPLAFTHENVNVFTSNVPAPPGIPVPPPEINYVDNPDNEPGITDNYTLSILNTKNVTDESEREHIQEHLKDTTTLDTSKMTKKELQFHYFKIQDTDNNQMLDGTEICKSMMHHHDEIELEKDGLPKIFTDDELARVVDTILYHDDFNKDGFIDYAEFKKAQDRVPDDN